MRTTRLYGREIMNVFMLSVCVHEFIYMDCNHVHLLPFLLDLLEGSYTKRQCRSVFCVTPEFPWGNRIGTPRNGRECSAVRRDLGFGLNLTRGPKAPPGA